MSAYETKKVEFKSEFSENAFFAEVSSEEEGFVSDFSKYAVFPGFCDVHVHFREPGFSYKETIKSGSMASAKGGYTSVCTMPNLNPVPDSIEHLKEQTDIIERDAVIEVLPYAAITIGEKGEELVDMESLAEKVIAFSDDGRGVQSEEMMREAMLRAREITMEEIGFYMLGAKVQEGDSHE